MSNRLIDVEIDETTLKSGDVLTAEIQYRGERTKDLVVTCSPGFLIHFDEEELSLPAAYDGRRSIRLSVERQHGPPPADCQLSFSYYNSVIEKWVAVR